MPAIDKLELSSQLDTRATLGNLAIMALPQTRYNGGVAKRRTRVAQPATCRDATTSSSTTTRTGGTATSTVTPRRHPRRGGGGPAAERAEARHRPGGGAGASTRANGAHRHFNHVDVAAGGPVAGDRERLSEPQLCADAGVMAPRPRRGSRRP